MRKTWHLGLLLVLGFPLCVARAEAATVTPSDRIVNYVAVRQQASGQSAEIGQLRPGDQAETLVSIPRWYQVQLTDGTVGYLFKSAVVEVTAAAPGPTQVAAATPT